MVNESAAAQLLCAVLEMQQCRDGEMGSDRRGLFAAENLLQRVCLYVLLSAAGGSDAGGAA